eukprot:TRINITY_DN6223_c0_g1_i2.p1 TRINITY_DN6223_c0_g1~~TRINITY_DN6223_c0_g1_i2.p1  ORF type:complete len:1701 (+),score=383.33 TRINITY_DN6223_c0_g1_i2:647-5104(+)
MATGGDDALLSVLSSRPLRLSLSEVASSKHHPGLARAWLAFLTSIQHQFVAAGYLATPIMNRVVPLLARFVASNASCTAPKHEKDLFLSLSNAAMELLRAIFAHGDEELKQSTADELIMTSANGAQTMEAFCEANTLAKKTRTKQDVGPGCFTLVLNDAVCSLCCPPAVKGQSQEQLGELALNKLVAADARTVSFIEGVIRTCLLRVKEREEEPEAWARLEVLTCELLGASWDPRVAAAPLLLLKLAKGLARVAGASQSTELSCGQRELAVKLLGWIAALDSSSHSAGQVASSSRATIDEGCSELQKLARSMPCDFTSDSKELGPQQLLLAYLEKASGDDTSNPCNSGFLLCSWAMPGDSAEELRRKAARKKNSSRQQKQQEAACKDAASAWELKAWASLQSLSMPLPTLIRHCPPQSESQRKQVLSGKRQASAATAASALYRQLLLPVEDQAFIKGAEETNELSLSPLQRARSVALYALVGQLKSSPLAHVRRQALTGVAAARSAVSPAAAAAGENAFVLGLNDDSPWVRTAAIDHAQELLGDAHEEERQAAIAAKLADPSSGVRRAAFRVSCTLLKANLPSERLVRQSADLLRRVWDETPNIRDMVLSSVERALLPQPLSFTSLSHLVSVVQEPGVGKHGLRQVLLAYSSQREKTRKEGQTLLGSVSEIALQGIQKVMVPAENDGASVKVGEALAIWTMMLQNVGQLEPRAIQPHVATLQTWLSDASSVIKGQATSNRCLTPQQELLARAACQLFRDCISTLIREGNDKTVESEELCENVLASLEVILRESGSGLTRDAVACLCAITQHSQGLQAGVAAMEELKVQSERSLAQLQSSMANFQAQSAAPIEASAQRRLLRSAWLLSSVLEFFDLDALQGFSCAAHKDGSGAQLVEAAGSGENVGSRLALADKAPVEEGDTEARAAKKRTKNCLGKKSKKQKASKDVSSETGELQNCGTSALVVCSLQAPEGIASITCKLICGFWRFAPPVLKPALLPCLGYLLRRHTALLRPEPGQLGPLLVLREALRSEQTTMRQSCAMVLAELLGVFEKAAEAEAPTQGSGDWGAVVARAVELPAISEAVQRLAVLQPELLDTLHQACRLAPQGPASVSAAASAVHAVEVLQCFSHLGVLHPNSALPALLSACLASPAQHLTHVAGKLLLKLVEASPQLLASSLGKSMAEASGQLCLAGACFGAAAMEPRRFAAIGKAYTEVLDAKKGRGRFLESLVAELVNVATGAKSAPSSPNSAGKSAQPLQPQLLRCEMLAGLVANLPLKLEAELGQVLRPIASCLTLKVLPLLQDAVSAEDFEQDLEALLNGARRSHGIKLSPISCTASLLLHGLSDYFCAAAGGNTIAERLLAADADKGTSEGEHAEDRTLPASFSRRQAPTFVGHILRQTQEAASSPAALLNLLVQYIPLDSILFRGSGLAGVAERKSRGKRKLAADVHVEAAKRPRRTASAKANSEQVQPVEPTPSMSLASAGA